jgi:hypothetical protein
VPRSLASSDAAKAARVWILSSAGVCVMRLEDIALAVVLMAALLLSLWLVKDA